MDFISVMHSAIFLWSKCERIMYNSACIIKYHLNGTRFKSQLYRYKYHISMALCESISECLQTHSHSPDAIYVYLVVYLVCNIATINIKLIQLMHSPFVRLFVYSFNFVIGIESNTSWMVCSNFSIFLHFIIIIQRTVVSCRMCNF